jgi:RHS repeat-associated protein
MFAGKQFDMVLGVDIHLVQLPAPGPPVPMPHPFFGMIYDLETFGPPPPYSPPPPPKSLLEEFGEMAEEAAISAAREALLTGLSPNLAKFAGKGMALKGKFDKLKALWEGSGSNVHINGLPHGNVGSKIKGTPHIPMGGAFVNPPANEGEVYMGSHSVAIAGKPVGRLGDIAMSCQCVPKPQQPLSMILAVPMGRPVLVGGMPVPDLKAMLQAAMNKAAGKMAAKAKKAMCPTFQKLARKVYPKGTPQNVKDAISKWTGEPVNVALGSMVTQSIDFQLIGLIPLQWETKWYSNSHHHGVLGSGWHHSYDICLGFDDEQKGASLRLSDGRFEAVPYLEEDGEFIIKKETIKLFRKNNRFGYFDWSSGLTYWFAEAALKPVVDAIRLLPLVKIENAYQQCIDFQYDEQGDLIQIKDSNNRILTVTNDAQHRICKIQMTHPIDNQLFSLVEYEYDAIGNLVLNRNALGHTRRFHYEKHLMTQKTDANGLSFYYKYEGLEMGSRCVHTWGDGGIHNHQLRYDDDYLCTTVTDSLGYQSKYFHNEMGIVTKRIYSDGSSWTKQYSEAAELLSETDELGRVTHYAYDDFSNIVKKVRPDGVAVQAVYQETLLMRYTDAVGGKWAFQYNAQRQITHRTDPLGRITQYEYNAVNGLLETITDAAMQKTQLKYDALNHLQQVILPDNAIMQWEHDAFGRCVKRTDIKGNQLFIHYDLIDNVVKVEEPDGNIRFFDYDNRSNLVRVRDRQRDIKMSYSGLNKLVARVEAGTRVTFEYDKEEQLSSIHNEHGAIYRFELDPKGNVVKEIGFDGVMRTYVRDVVGQVSEVKRGVPSRMLFQRNTILSSKYQYDKMGQLIDIQHNDGTSEQFEYRPDGALMMAKNLHATVRFERDVMGRLVKEFQNDYWIESEYDLLDHRIKMQSVLHSKFTFERNGFGDVERMSVNGRTDVWETTFKRDAAGLEIHRQMTGGVQSRWERDQLGRPLEQITTVGGARQRHKSYDWGFDDRLHAIKDLVKGASSHIEFGHDAVGNLAWAQYGDGSMEYRMPDAVGNLFKTQWQTDRRYGPAGQLLEANGTRFDYDIEGNLIRKTESNGKIWRYDWNAAGFLKHVQRPDGALVSFTYDALGRRLSKTYLDKMTHWIWDGNLPLHEWQSDTGYYPMVDWEGVHYDPTMPNNVITWAFEAETFAPIAKITDFGRYSIVTDHLGTPAAMFDEGGKSVWSMQLDTYGAIREHTGALNDCPFRYQGQYEDVATGLYYNRFRYYDPEIGQYISQDPIRLTGGLTIYAYINDVNIWTDPFGLAKRKTVDLGEKHKGGIDIFNTGGSASFEIHVYDKRGNELGVRGPDGWINKHGHKDAPVLPKTVEDNLNQHVQRMKDKCG